MAESAQFLIEHGHTHEQIVGYPPHLFGRYAIAAKRLDEQQSRTQVLNNWVSGNASFDDMQRFIGQKPSTPRAAATRASHRAETDISPRQSRNAALGLASALGMAVSRK